MVSANLSVYIKSCERKQRHGWLPELLALTCCKVAMCGHNKHTFGDEPRHKTASGFPRNCFSRGSELMRRLCYGRTCPGDGTLLLTSRPRALTIRYRNFRIRDSVCIITAIFPLLSSPSSLCLLSRIVG
jgi:hypothetical protein